MEGRKEVGRKEGRKEGNTERLERLEGLEREGEREEKKVLKRNQGGV